jgi:ELP3 family radical SAM enzyme/protein acetyltransferase
MLLKMVDIESIVPETRVNLDGYVKELCQFDGVNWKLFQKNMLRKYKFSTVPRRADVSYTYRKLLKNGEIEINKALEENILVEHKSTSGVMVMTIATKPDKFSCKYNCYYCPNEPNQPRSYLSDEPVLIHANNCNFDVVKQFFRRGKSLHYMENKLDKLEVIIIGGTWTCYDHQYQEEFIRDIYYASNIFFDMLDNKTIRDRMDLETEKVINQTTQCRIISLTLETRPDMITNDEIRRFRKYGCTKVQIGIQHIDDEILRYINRQCYYKDIVRAIKILKDNGFKIDIHIMPAKRYG